MNNKAWILGFEKMQFIYIVNMDTFIDGETEQCVSTQFYKLDLVDKTLVTDLGTFEVVETYKEFLALGEKNEKDN